MASLENQAGRLNLDLGVYTDAVDTLSRLQPHISADQAVVLVGSLANRVQFPDYYKGSSRTIGDIDLAMQPPVSPAPVATSLMNDFALTASYEQFGAYSLFLTDKANLNEVNMFVGERSLETVEVLIGGNYWKIPTQAEILLKVMRDIFTFDAKHTPGQKGWQLPEKHREFYRYMTDPSQGNLLEALAPDIEQIWETEIETLQTNIEFETEMQAQTPDRRFKPRISQFTTFGTYLAAIQEIVEIDDNFLPEGEKQTLVGEITEDGREKHGLQEPYGLKIADSEEYLKLKNAIEAKKK